MKATIKVVNVYQGILEETEKHILVESEGKRYLGTLLDNEARWIDEEIRETLDSREIEGTIEEVIDAILEMRAAHGLSVYKDSKKTLAWWGYLNGVFPEHINVC